MINQDNVLRGFVRGTRRLINFAIVLRIILKEYDEIFGETNMTA